MPRKTIHNADENLQVRKLCLESRGEGSKKEGKERGITESPWHPTVTCSILI